MWYQSAGAGGGTSVRVVERSPACDRCKRAKGTNGSPVFNNPKNTRCDIQVWGGWRRSVGTMPTRPFSQPRAAVARPWRRCVVVEGKFDEALFSRAPPPPMHTEMPPPDESTPDPNRVTSSGSTRRTACAGWWRISVTGRGIPPENLDVIFEPFQQSQPADQHRGTGLGLSISRQLARLMGVTSQPRASWGSDPGSPCGSLSPQLSRSRARRVKTPPDLIRKLIQSRAGVETPPDLVRKSISVRGAGAVNGAGRAWDASGPPPSAVQAAALDSGLLNVSCS